MLTYLKLRPMLIAALGCALTAVCGYYSVRLLCILAPVLTASLIVTVTRQNAKSAACLFLILIVFISSILTSLKISRLNRLSDRKIAATAVICSIEHEGDFSSKSEVQILKSDKIPPNTRISLWYEPANVKEGQIIKLDVTPQRVSRDLRLMYYGRGIFLEGKADCITPTNDFDLILRASANVKNYIKTTFFRSMSFESAATMCALVFGDMDYLSDDFYANTKKAGVIHVLVVSGMHLCILVSLALRFSKKRLYNKYLTVLTMLSVVVAVCFVCGFTMSILRAGITYTVMALGILLGKPYSGEISLSFAVILILSLSPLSIFNVGFLLSVLSTFGIFAVAQPVIKYLKLKFRLKALPLYAVEGTVISLSALILTMPVVIYIFGYIAVYSVIANILIDSALTFCLSVAVIALGLGLLFPAIGTALLRLCDLVTAYVNAVINYIGGLENSTKVVPRGGALASVAIIFVIFYGLAACKKRQDMLKLKIMSKKFNSKGVTAENGSNF